MQHEWREGNRVILLPEASRFLPAMFEAVSQAQHYVLVAVSYTHLTLPTTPYV